MQVQTLTLPAYMRGTYQTRAYVSGDLSIIKRGKEWQIIQTATGACVGYPTSHRLLARVKANLATLQALPCDWSLPDLVAIAKSGGMGVDDLRRIMVAMQN